MDAMAMVMTEQEVIESAQEAEAAIARMFQVADLERWTEEQAAAWCEEHASDEEGDDEDPEPPTPAAPACRECGDSGVVRFFTGWKLSDWVAEPCRCRVVAVSPAPMAPNPAPVAVPTINHPGMTVAWFDQAVHRAICDGCRVIGTGVAGVLFVTSGSSSVTYRVTRETCTCKGHQEVGRCKHRALAIATADVFRLVATATRPAA